MAKAKYNPGAFREDPLAALKQATTASDSPERAEREEPRLNLPQTMSSAPAKPLSATLKPSRNTMYLYPEDLTRLRQLSGYAAIEHGVRANDSMIVRAALSLMEADVRFLHALKEAELSDRRRTRL